MSGLFQSTRPRGARRNISDAVTESINVSIHAPTRGATGVGGMGQLSIIVSIHAPTRGATPAVYPGPDPQIVSIHAPTRGATQRS